MLNKLYDMGILGAWLLGYLTADVGAKPSDIENKVTVSSIARRRLAVVATRLKMAESVSDVSGGGAADSQAVRTIEQGHIRVGPSPVTDPAMLITRHMEDFVTWVDTSARKRTIMKYNDEVGGYEGISADGSLTTLIFSNGLGCITYCILSCHRVSGNAADRLISHTSH